jgi:hypothetical protein
MNGSRQEDLLAQILLTLNRAASPKTQATLLHKCGFTVVEIADHMETTNEHIRKLLFPEEAKGKKGK